VGLKLYNTFTRSLEEFVPQRETVGIYSCGLTVQGAPHVGHMRAYIVRDVLVRWIEHLGYEVLSLENFTDIDDKIIEKQLQQKRDWRVIAQENITKYLNAVDQLNIKRAHFYPRASEHIEEIIHLVQELIDKGYGYEKGGDVYFKVRKFPDYGRLSKKSIDDLVSGARIAPSEHKEDPLDFALWKAAKPGEPSWFSPWGKGRPGWHIECSAMAMHYLGESFDIHTGGEDLIFPHHENEIAQSVAATGQPFVRYWLHNGWVTLSGEKMAKSTGHFFLIEDLLKEYHPNVIRLYLLKTHYRNQIEFSNERLDEAKAAYHRILTFLSGFKVLPAIDKALRVDEFTDAMNDDLNAPKALGIIFDMVNKGYEQNDPEIAASIKIYLGILGFRDEEPVVPFSPAMDVFREITKRLVQEGQDVLIEGVWKHFYHTIEGMRSMDDVFPALVGFLLDIRNQFRKNKKYEYADFIREKLAQQGIQIHDEGVDKSTFTLEIR
jgi:cysteinyl-tRNA synthetase